MSSQHATLLPKPAPRNRSQSAYALRGKPWLDRVLLCLCAGPALLLAVPIALANWVVFRSFRQVLFLQARVGQHGRVYTLYKFRTMRDVRSGQFESWQSGAEQLRVTRLGRWLRNTHLDELPQFLNVARGEMSFIGPRPEMVEVEAWAEAQLPGFGRRLVLRPGLTGLAQITQGYAGQDVAAYAEKLRINQQYLREVSLRTDLQILVRTAVWMLRGRGWDWKRQGAHSSASAAVAAVDPTHVLVPAARRSNEAASLAQSSTHDG